VPALPPVAGVIRLQFQGSYQAAPNVIWRMFFRYTGTAPTAAQLNTWCATMFTGAVSDITPYQHAEYTLLATLAEDLSTASSAVGIHSGSQAGTRGGLALPGSVAALINLHISRRYRGGKPRIYLPAGNQADILNAQQWGATFITNLQAAYAALVAYAIANPPGTATLVTQVNVSYYNGFTVFNPGGGRRAKNIPTLRGTPLVDDVSSASVNGRFASQRRRNRP
jgi:hypothetical protein